MTLISPGVLKIKYEVSWRESGRDGTNRELVVCERSGLSEDFLAEQLEADAGRDVEHTVKRQIAIHDQEIAHDSKLHIQHGIRAESQRTSPQRTEAIARSEDSAVGDHRRACDDSRSSECGS